jgi:hypothetical protein
MALKKQTDPSESEKSAYRMRLCGRGFLST